MNNDKRMNEQSERQAEGGEMMKRREVQASVKMNASFKQRDQIINGAVALIKEKGYHRRQRGKSLKPQASASARSMNISGQRRMFSILSAIGFMIR